MLAQLHRRLAYIQRSSLVLAQTLDATLQDAACWARSGGPYHFGGVAGRRPGPYVYTHTRTFDITGCDVLVLGRRPNFRGQGSKHAKIVENSKSKRRAHKPHQA